jgi:multiple sugar transport system ATP-binding protein
VQMRTEIKALHQRLGSTSVYVTHDQIEAMTMADKIVVMRDGRIEQAGAPLDVYDHPRNLFVAGFIGSPGMNFVPGEIRDSRLVLPMAQVALKSNLSREGQVIAGIRPEHFQDAALNEDLPGQQFEAKVDVLEWLGSDLYVHFQVECAAERLRALPDELERKAASANRISLVARVDPASKAAESERLRLWLDSSEIRLFDAESGERLAF